MVHEYIVYAVHYLNKVILHGLYVFLPRPRHTSNAVKRQTPVNTKNTLPSPLRSLSGSRGSTGSDNASRSGKNPMAMKNAEIQERERANDDKAGIPCESVVEHICDTHGRWNCFRHQQKRYWTQTDRVCDLLFRRRSHSRLTMKRMMAAALRLLYPLSNPNASPKLISAMPKMDPNSSCRLSSRCMSV